MLEIPSYFTRLYTAAEIDKRVDEIAAQITEDFAGRKVHLVGVLRGATSSCQTWCAASRSR